MIELRPCLLDQAVQLIRIELPAPGPDVGDDLPQRGGGLLLPGRLEEVEVLHADDGGGGLAELLHDVLHSLAVANLVENPLNLPPQV